jgi:hypothetical protein
VTDDRRRAIHASGRIVERETGDVLATADGVFIAVPPAQLAALKARYRLRPGGGETSDPSAAASSGGRLAEPA